MIGFGAGLPDILAAPGGHHQNPSLEIASHGRVCVCVYGVPETGEEEGGYGLMQVPWQNPGEVRGVGPPMRGLGFAPVGPSLQRFPCFKLAKSQSS